MKSLPICNCLSGLCFSIFPNLSKSCISLSHTYLKDQSRITPRRIIRAPFLHVPYYYPTHYISCQFSTIQHAIKQGALYSLSLYLRQRWIQFCYLHSQALWLATFALDYYTISLSFLFSFISDRVSLSFYFFSLIISIILILDIVPICSHRSLMAQSNWNLFVPLRQTT